MSFRKTMFTSLLAIGIGSVSLCAQAAPSGLTIVNNTNHDSTSIINNGACSTILGDAGITRAHSTNVVPESKINLACIANKSNCTADVFMTTNCSGPKVATAVFDTKTGIKSVTVHDSSYAISGGGFNISISGGPALASK